MRKKDTPTEPVKSRVYSPAQLRIILGVSESTLRRMWHSGDLPAPIYLSERLIAWEKTVISSWLASRKTKTVRLLKVAA